MPLGQPRKYRGHTTPASEPQSVQLSVARYEAVLARLRAYPRIHVSVNESLPRTPEELSREAGALFVKTAFWFDRLAYDSERLVPRTKEYEAYVQGLYARAVADRMHARAETPFAS